jgi:hypothetical protein
MNGGKVNGSKQIANKEVIEDIRNKIERLKYKYVRRKIFK